MSYSHGDLERAAAQLDQPPVIQKVSPGTPLVQGHMEDHNTLADVVPRMHADLAGLQRKFSILANCVIVLAALVMILGIVILLVS